MGGFMSPPGLYATQRCEQLLRRDRHHRAVANVRIQEALEPRAENGNGLRRECLALEFQPFGRDCFKCLRPSAPLRFAPGAGIDSVRDQLAHVVALLSRTLEGDVGIRAQGEEFLPPVHGIAQAPQATARRRHEHEESALVEQLVRPVDRSRSADSSLGEEGHKSGVGKILGRPYPRFLPSSKEGCPQTRLTIDRQFYTSKQSVTVQDGTRWDGVGQDSGG